MEQLPPELLYYIISKLDGRSLGCASGVNRQWRSVVTNLGKVFNIWFRVCWKEMGVDWLIAQTGMTWLATEDGQANVQSQLSRWMFWRDLFAANCRCGCLDTERWEVEMEPVFEDNTEEDVVATDIHPCGHLYGDGKFVAGYRGGDIYLFSLDTVTAADVLPRHLARHVHAPSAVAALSLGGCCPGYHSGMKKEPMLAVSSSEIGDVILSNSTQTTYHPFGSHIFCISSLGEYFAVGSDKSQRDGIMVYRRKEGKGCPVSDPQTDMSIEAILQLRGCLASNTRALALAYNQVVAGDKEGNLYCWQFKPLCCMGTGGEGKGGRRGKGKGGPERINEPSDSMKLGRGIEQVVIHQYCVLALTDETSVYVIKRKDWSVVRCIADSRLRALAVNCASAIVRLAGCAHLLAVGFSSGEVVVLNTSAKNWNMLQPCHVVSQFHCQVNKLVTLNFTLGPKGPELLVAGDRIFVCKWRRRGTEHAEDDVPLTGENVTDLKELVPVVRKIFVKESL